MPLLEVKNVGKDFDGNVVLEDISFPIEAGEIIGLCGENGAGKSTLMNILFGMPVIQATGGYKGQILLNGEEVHFQTPTDALKAGIGMVHQEFSQIPGFTAAENIMLNREITKENTISKLTNYKKLKKIEVPAIMESAQTSINQLGVDMPAQSIVSELPVGYKQFIEIAREINKENVKLLILDEPTAVLTETEAEILLAAIRELASRKISIIFISHRLREIMDVCNRVVVMRDGHVVADQQTEKTTIPEIANWMIGRTVNAVQRQAREENHQEVVLQVRNLQVDMPGEAVRNATFDVYKGEIFGIAGLAGQGKLGIPNGIMGIYPSEGEVVFKGEKIPLNSPKEAQKRGLAFVSEDRRGVGLLVEEPISWNICFNAMQIRGVGLKKVMGINFRSDKVMKQIAEEYIEELQIKTTGPRQKVMNLSGGNQQKVCLAKAFCLEPELLLVSEPTRGIDVGAKALVLEALKKYREKNGTTIIIVSSELEELRSIADRIAVVTEGEIIGTLDSARPASEFGLLMSGETEMEANQ